MLFPDMSSPQASNDIYCVSYFLFVFFNCRLDLVLFLHSSLVSLNFSQGVWCQKRMVRSLHLEGILRGLNSRSK